MATLTYSENPLMSFLRSHDTTKDKSHCSVTGMGHIKGKWVVSDEDYPQFLDILHNYLFIQKQRPNNLVEQRNQDGYAPILIDLDFKYPNESAIQRQFSMINIATFIEIYVAALSKYFNLSIFESLRFFITLRPSPYEDKKNSIIRSLKDGVHIECPDLVLHSEYQQVIRHIVLESDIISRSFRDTNYINSPKDIFDESVVKKQGWFFFGESKPDVPAYSLASTYIYHPLTNTFEMDDITTNIPTRDLIGLLSIRHNLDNRRVDIREEYKNEWDEKSSTVLHGALTICNTGNEDFMECIPRQQRRGYTEDEIYLAKTMAIKCLSVERADNYTSWMEVGWCLHSIDKSDNMFDCWIQFSNKSTKSSGNNIEHLRRDWNNGWGRRGEVSSNEFTNRSIHYWAKLDNPEEYNNIIQNDTIAYIERSADATHTHIARLMHRIYFSAFRASVTARNTEWYKYDGIWFKIPQGIELRNKLTCEIAPLIARTREISRAKSSASGNDDISFGNRKSKGPANPHEARFEKLLSVEKQLYNCGFKDSVMKECIGLFCEENMAKRLNTNQYTLGFANGVVDLRSEYINEKGELAYRVEFRQGRPNDYISFMAGRIEERSIGPIDYIPYDPTDSMQIEVNEFMRKVFPNIELREYMWRKLASCLEGTNREQVYDTWIGRGGNGKSKLVELVTMTFGDYASSLQSTALTRKRPDSGAANPDIMSIRNKRFIYMSEPDDKEPLNTSRMKQFTGEDVVEARALYEDQTKFQITGKLFMLCNALPVINAMDKGTWRRIRVIPFESSFVDPASTDINPAKNIYPRDMFMDAKLQKWRTCFMSRLIHVYETEYTKRGLDPIPNIIITESKKYQETYDSFGKFTNARIRTIKGENSTFKDIYSVYRDWVTLMGSSAGKRLNMSELQKRLDEEFGEPTDSRKTYKRCKIFESDTELEKYDEEISNSN